MLKNAPFLITIGVDTAENEPRKESWVVTRTGVSILILEPAMRRPKRRAAEAASVRSVPRSCGSTSPTIAASRRRFWSNFSKIGTSDSERGRIFQRFSRSTRFSHFFQKIMNILLRFLLFSQKSVKYPELSENLSKITNFL